MPLQQTTIWPPRRESYLHVIAKTPIPFHTVQIDHLGPFQRTPKSNMFLIVTIDTFTKYVVLKLAKSTKVRFVINLLGNMCKTFGLPSRIITDRGTAFTSHTFKKYCRQQNIQLILNAVATPHANGQVERLNRTIVNILATTSDTEDNWDSHVDSAQIAIDNTVHQITNKSSNQLLKGYSSRAKSDVLSAVARNIEQNQTQKKQRLDKTRKKPESTKLETLTL